MKQLRLSGRLSAVAAFIEKGASVVDVGTDHGFLPAYLVQTGRARRVCAADVRKSPLARARETAAALGLSDRIDFILADGLDGIDPARYDTVVMAGMGGETIAGILDRAAWPPTGGRRYVLQPQTKVGMLAEWLAGHGYGLIDAALAQDGGRLYPVLLAGCGGNGSVDVLGRLFEKRDPHLPEYVGRLAEKLRRELEGHSRGGAGVPREKEERLDALLKMKEEIIRWPR